MASTKGIPTAFHQELSEYASLLRTIRTNSTLDFVPQLSRPKSARDETDDSSNSEDGYDCDKGRGSRLSSDDFNNYQGHDEIFEGKENPKRPSRSGRRKSEKDEDTWTRWPLLLEHAGLPEWGLDEEIKTIAEHSLRHHASHNGPPSRLTQQIDADRSSKEGLDDDLDHAFLTNTHLSGLVLDASSKLSSLLSLLAMHRPNATYTKHSRVDPMGWEDILEVVAAVELFDQRVIEDVKRRMEEVLGPSGTQVNDHMQVLTASKRALATATEKFGGAIPSLVGPSPAKSIRGRKRKRNSNKPASEDDVEVHAMQET